MELEFSGMRLLMRRYLWGLVLPSCRTWDWQRSNAFSIQLKSSSAVEMNLFQSGGIKMFFYELLYSCNNTYLWYNNGHTIY